MCYLRQLRIQDFDFMDFVFLLYYFALPFSFMLAFRAVILFIFLF